MDEEDTVCACAGFLDLHEASNYLNWATVFYFVGSMICIGPIRYYTVAAGLRII